MFCTDIILSIFRIIIGIWIIYSGIMNLRTVWIWKDLNSRLWLFSLVIAVIMIFAGVYILIYNGAILQTIGIIIVGYGIMDIVQNIIFIKKVDDFLE